MKEQRRERRERRRGRRREYRRQKRIEKDSTDFDFLEEKIPETVLRVYGSSGSKVRNSGNVWNKVKIYGASSFDSHRRK